MPNTTLVQISTMSVLVTTTYRHERYCWLVFTSHFKIKIIIQRSKYVPQWYVQDYKSLFAVMPKGHWVFNLITIGLRQIFTGSHLRQSYGRIILNLISHRPASAL